MVDVDIQEKALKGLFGLPTLPQSGKEAEAASRQICSSLLSAIPMQEALVLPLQAAMARDSWRLPSDVRRRFVDVGTGMRLSYAQWNASGEDKVLLLHDAHEDLEMWLACAAALSDRGYHVIALDLRGHGDSSLSGDQRYSARVLAEDVKAFVIELDLYARPMAVLGAGVGAIVALTLASMAPSLVGGLVLFEFALSPAGDSDDEEDGLLGSSRAAESADAAPSQADWRALRDPSSLPSFSQPLSPLWSWNPFQAAIFAGSVHAASVLSHPLSNLAPRSLVAVSQSLEARGLQDADEAGAKSNQGGEDNAASEMPRGHEISEPSPRALGPDLAWHLSRLQRPLPEAAVAALRDTRALPAPNRELLSLRADSAWFFAADTSSLERSLLALGCPLQLCYAERSVWISAEDAAHTAGLVARGGAGRVVELAAVPGVGRGVGWMPSGDMVAAACRFLDARVLAHLARSVSEARRPELMDLKSLPRFETLEEAQKALGARPIPTAEAVQEALRELAGDEEEEEDEVDAYQTALANNPSDYFGFVG